MKKFKFRENIVLFGGGAGSLHCIGIIEAQRLYNIIGIIDSSLPIGQEIYGYKIIGREENLLDLIRTYEIEGGLITIGDNWSRYSLHQKIMKMKSDFRWVNAIHPLAVIGKDVKLGFGLIVYAGATIAPMSNIGNFCRLFTNSIIEQENVFEDYSSISVGSQTAAFVKVGKYSAITLNSTISDRIIIGENSVIGASSLIIKDVPDNVLVYGSPAKIIRRRKAGERFLKLGGLNK